MINRLVSVIMPLHNDEQYLRDAVESVISQSYTNWELLIVDDCSTDASPCIIEEYCRQDERIRIFKTENPSGSPTLPRNIGIEQSGGGYISFLDSDDQWLPNKLERQVACFEEHPDAVIVYSNYKKTDEHGRQHRHQVTAPSCTDYGKLLKGNVIGCLTAIYDAQKIGKRYFAKCGHEDYALWLSILREGGIAFNTNTVEGLYRIRGFSVSSNKLRTMKWQWDIYRKREKLGLLKSLYYFTNYAIKAVKKRRK